MSWWGQRKERPKPVPTPPAGPKVDPQVAAALDALAREVYDLKVRLSIAERKLGWRV